jgi:hypothetical protein
MHNLSKQMRIMRHLENGTSDAYTKLDEVARNGVLQEELRPEVFLGTPCIF